MEKLDKAEAPSARHENRDASAVVQRESPLSIEAWQQRLAGADGLIEPAVEALLAEYGTLRRRVEALSRHQKSLTALVDRLKLGVALFQDGTLIVSNRAAETALHTWFSQDPLSDFKDDTLESALKQVEDAPSAAFTVAKDGSKVHALVLAGDADGSAIVILHDPDTEIEGDAGVYQVHFGFTPTEATVATYLVRGFAPREIASSLGVGVETTRTHVKHILAKMGCNRQVDAVRRLAVGPALFL